MERPVQSIFRWIVALDFLEALCWVRVVVMILVECI